MYKNFFGESPSIVHGRMNPIEFAQMSNATAYARMNTKLTQHMEDSHVHIDDEERDKWNKKADKVDLEKLQLDMLKKANSSEIPTLVSQLKNDESFVTSDAMNSRLSSLDYVTWSELKRKGYATQSELSSYATKDDLSAYATKADLTGYVKFSDIANYMTPQQVANYINGLGFVKNEDLAQYAKSSDLGIYAKLSDIDGYVKTSDIQPNAEFSNALIHSLSLVDDSGDGVAYVLYIDQDGTVKANLSSPIHY